jgi:hypothetical protein
MRGFKTLSQNIPPIEAISPGTTGDADRYGDWISLKNAPNGVAVVVHVDQANAAQPTISINQSTSVDGGGSPTDEKAIAKEVPIFTNLDCAGGDALTEQDAAVSYKLDAVVKHKIVVMEVKPEHLDVDNDFDCIRVKVVSSNVANLISAMYLPLGQRYPSESMIAD